MQKFSITPGLRNDLKSPLGELVNDSSIEKGLFEKYFHETHLTVCVGDRTTERIHEFGFSPNLEIIDMIERRVSRLPPISNSSNEKIIRAINEAGSICSDSLHKLDRCLRLILRDRLRTVRLVVEGEEDLLALPVVAFFPEETVVFYGQPNEGLVIVDSNYAKQRAREILAQIGVKSLKVGK